MFIAYRESFNDIDLNPHNYIVHQASLNLDLYKLYIFGERKGKCYILRKGKNQSDLPNWFDGLVIDNLPETEKVRILNECEYCYCYDTQTAYSSIAAICGCISVVVPEPGKTRKDYVKGRRFGFAYGDNKEEVEWAISTLDKLRESLDYSESNLRNAKHFIAFINKKFEI